MGIVAAIQTPPVYLDAIATARRAAERIAEAARNGAWLAVLPESFIPGYPDWAWRVAARSSSPSAEPFNAYQRRFVEQAITVPGPVTDVIAEACRAHHIMAAVGVTERPERAGTLYNTLLYFGADGTILGRHRKMVPTFVERVVWGQGDGTTLRAIPTEHGVLGGLICWENYMPLARYALYAEGVQIYLAPTWDMGSGWVSSMVHIAREGRCWVIGSGTSLQGRDIPGDFPHRDVLFPGPDEWVNEGDSVIVAPDGAIVAGPLNKEHGILYAECDPERATTAHRTLDVTGHYSRPDIFKLEVWRAARAPVDFKNGDQTAPAPAARTKKGAVAASRSEPRARKRPNNTTSR